VASGTGAAGDGGAPGDRGGHAVGVKTGNREQGTGNREQGTGTRE